MVTQYIDQKLLEKSTVHRADLKKLGQSFGDHPLSQNVVIIDDTPQLQVMNTIIQDRMTCAEEFVFYFDRISTLLIEWLVTNPKYTPVSY